MIEKERQILDSATKLFSEKGYSFTSMQDIASECGIAKGSIYSYYTSKYDLLIATLNYNINRILSQVKELGEQYADPRDRIIAKLTFFFEMSLARRKLVDLQTYDKELLANGSFKQFLVLKQHEIHRLYREGLLSVYGESVRPYLHDLTFMTEGMLRSFLNRMLIDASNLHIRTAVEYVMKRVDDIANGLLNSQAPPLFSEKQINEMVIGMAECSESTVNQIRGIVADMRTELQGHPHGDDYLITLQIIDEELSKEQPREQVISGMLYNLKGVEQVDNHLKEIRKLLIEL